MKIIAVDTEYTYDYKAFVATTTDEQLKSRLYILSDKKDFLDLKKICESKNISKVFHATCNDIYALQNIGIDVVPPYNDTFIAARLVNENFQAAGLKKLAAEILDEPCLEEKALSKLKSKIKREAKKAGKVFSYDMIPKELLYPYAIKDTEYTMKLWYYFMEPLKKYKTIYDFEISLIPHIVKMVSIGFHVDRKFVKSQIKLLNVRKEKLHFDLEKMFKKADIKFTQTIERKKKESIVNYCDKHNLDLTGIKYNIKTNLFTGFIDEEFNLSSPKHIAHIIKSFDIPITETTDKMSLATDKETLKKYVDIHPFIQMKLDDSSIEKQLTTYYEPLLNYYTTNKNPIAHFMFYQSGAKTGRFTAELIQTIPKHDELAENPKEVRKAFTPREGYTLVCIDYDQIEMRLFAHYSKCQTIIDRIKNGFDPHLGTAIDIFGKKLINMSEKISKFCRKAAKNINFGIIYGMGQNKLKEQLASVLRSMKKELPKNYALPLPQEILHNYYEQYPVKEFMRQMTGELYRTGVIDLTLDSELMCFTRDYKVPQELAYKAVNIKIQGCAAYVMKFGMKRCIDYIIKHNLDILLIGTVHDELIFEINNEYDINKQIRKLIELMEDKITFNVPILASAKISTKSWGDAKEVKL